MLPFAGVLKWFRHDVLRITPQRVCAIGLMCLAALVYLPFLTSPLVFDDFNIINGPNFLDNTFNFTFAPRWLPYATIGHTYALTDGDLSAMRWGNLIIHASSTV